MAHILPPQPPPPVPTIGTPRFDGEIGGFFIIDPTRPNLHNFPQGVLIFIPGNGQNVQAPADDYYPYDEIWIPDNNAWNAFITALNTTLDANPLNAGPLTPAILNATLAAIPLNGA